MRRFLGLLSQFGLFAFLAMPTEAFARLCTPKTRCTDYSKCYINNVPQPCAYGSGGAYLAAIYFRGGFYEIEYLPERKGKDKAEVIYTKFVNGKWRKVKVMATTSEENGYRVLRLSDGVVLKYPVSGGRHAWLER